MAACEPTCSPVPVDPIGCSGSFCFGAYYPNWTQYRTDPYTFTPTHLKDALSMYDYLVYSFGKFDPNTFVVSGTEDALGTIKDSGDAGQIAAIRKAAITSGKPNFKLLFSIGGWSFPAAYWSLALSTPSNRDKLIKNCVKYLEDNNLQGIDIDWEFPGMEPTTKYVQKAHTCFEVAGVQCNEQNYDGLPPVETGPFQGVCSIADAGQGQGFNDFENLASFTVEMSAVFRRHSPPYMLTIASSASPDMISQYNFTKMIPAIDVWHVMAYDFWVSDTDNEAFSGCTAPTAPLHSAFKPTNRVAATRTNVGRDTRRRLDPSRSCRPTGADQDLSVDHAIQMYRTAGVDPKKMSLGLAFYGHTWYVPDLAETDYGKFGVRSSIQENNCCGPLAKTYGGYGGTAAVLCGSLLYSEINLNRTNLHITEDDTTKSTIGYWSDNSRATGGVPAGTWISYNSPTSLVALTQYAMDQGLRGVFAWDISSDTVLPAANGTSQPLWTFDLSRTVHDTLNRTTDSVCGSHACPYPSFCVNRSGTAACYCGNGVVYNEQTGCSDDATPPTPPASYNGICTFPSSSNSCKPCNSDAECGTGGCWAAVDPGCCPQCTWHGTCTPNWNSEHSVLSDNSCVCGQGYTGADCSIPSSDPPPPPPPPTGTCPSDCHYCYDTAATACMDPSYGEAQCNAWAVGDTRYRWCG